MKAVLCKQYGLPDALVLEDLPSLAPAAGQVVVSMKAAGVNFPDTLIIQGKYQMKPPFPFSPGTELAGVVKAVGAGASEGRSSRTSASGKPYCLQSTAFIYGHPSLMQKFC